jgi:hypothetical protein
MKREVEKKERVGNKKRQQLISSEAMELGENIHVFWLESQYIYIYIGPGQMPQKGILFLLDLILACLRRN